MSDRDFFNNNLNDIGRDRSGNLPLLKELAQCYTSVENFDKAIESYCKAIAMAPLDCSLHVALGMVLMQAERLDESAGVFNNALSIDSTCSEAYSGLAMIHQKRQEYPAAFDMYLRCLELDTDNLVALLGLFQASCQMGNFGKVIHYLELYLSDHDDDAAVLFCLATLYARDGRLEDARNALIKVLEIDPEKTQAADMLIQVNQTIVKNLLKQPA